MLTCNRLIPVGCAYFQALWEDEKVCCVCVYIYLYVCAYVYLCLCVHVCLYVCLFVCVFVCDNSMCACVYKITGVYVIFVIISACVITLWLYVYIYMNLSVYICLSTFVCVIGYVYVNVHTYIHASCHKCALLFFNILSPICPIKALWVFISYILNTQ